MSRQFNIGHYNDIHHFGVRLLLTHYDYRPQVGIMWNSDADSACGRTRHAHFAYLPMIPWRIAYRWRRIGLLHIERAWRSLMLRLIDGYGH